ncbi:MAG: thiamine phosphate synthase [Bauldia sp.]|nr:thiamine phosphate synthase [Bauldia sp.]
MADRIEAPRLCLVTPGLAEPRALAAAVEAALAGGDVASLIIAAEGASAAALQRIAEIVVPVATARGVAALVAGEASVALRTKADGVHVETGVADLRAALARLHPKGIVGAGGIASRHDAMTLGEAGPDYVFFGRLDGDDAPSVHDRALDLAAWWAELFEIPAILMAGSVVASVGEAAAARVEFVALRRAVWDHPDGPGAAVAEANRLLRHPADAAA